MCLGRVPHQALLTPTFRSVGDHMNSPTQGAPGGGDSYSEDSMRIDALVMKTKIGPKDELANPHDGKTYLISTIRYPGAGWQTAVFDRKRVLWLMRPIFRINEMNSAITAAFNHCTAIIIVAEAPPKSWPVGMKWDEPTEESWSQARAKIEDDILKIRDEEALVSFYSEVRRRYNCTYGS